MSFQPVPENKAAQWLIAEFDATDPGEINTDSYNPVLGDWSRPIHVSPTITFKSGMDVCQPMRVRQSDYTDPLRRWL